MSWIFTSLKSGPLPSDDYRWNITGLSATTVYAYRAYVVIDGIVYTGEIFTGITSVIPTYPPSGVTTGNATGITATSFNVTGSSVGWKGIVPIEEYGILYTQNPIWGTEANLTYENAANFSKESILGDIGEDDLFNNVITSLMPGTLTYFRAFAKNSSGIGYGIVKTVTTASLDVELYFDSIVSGNIATIAANNLSLQTMTIVFEYHVDANANNNYDYPGTYFNQATTYLEISLDGGSSWTYIDTVTAECDQPQDDDYQESNGIYTITGINASNIDLIRIRGNYDCNNDRNYQTGYFSIKISNTSTIDSGTLIIVPIADEFDEGCNTLPTIS